MTYAPDFYDTIRAGCIASADRVVPLIEPSPDRVLDVGCGEGWWAARFAADGAHTVRVDGAHVSSDLPVDLTDPLPDLGRFDLTVCLEVAEHLPAGRARPFVGELCQTADRILFSAAIPGQPGDGHVNCQWPAYWSALFAEHGYGTLDELRWTIWDDETIEPWYRQNLLLFDRDEPGIVPRAVVHPEIWGWFR